MVRNIVVLGGSSHPELTETICNHLGIPPAKRLLAKFAVGETRVEIQESVRGKDVFIIQSGGGKVNDHLMELLIMVSACKTASAKRVTVVLPLFPYSRQSDLPYNKIGAPLVKASSMNERNGDFTFNSRPQTPYPGQFESMGVNGTGDLHRRLNQVKLNEINELRRNGMPEKPKNGERIDKSEKHEEQHLPKRRDTLDSKSDKGMDYFKGHDRVSSNSSVNGAHHELLHSSRTEPPQFQPQRGYRQWVAQAGTLIADLLTCAGTDHVITMDLHDPQYQGFFDIPVDNLYGRHLLRKYIQYNVPNYQNAVIVSPDAGGAKRATAIADALGMPFALIHKVCTSQC
jgi:ribose-phosphate pyrophosphokinase